MRKLFLSLFVFGCFINPVKLFAETDYQVWQAFFQQGRITNKFGYWLDANYRTRTNFLQNFSVAIIRAGATYYIKDNIRLTGGYAYMLQFPLLDKQSFVKHEHRPWQMFQYMYTNKRSRLQTAFRAEQRFIQKSKGDKILDGYELRVRFRLAATFSYQLNKNKLPCGNISLIINDEVMMHGYSTDKSNLFDQNRVFAGFGFQVTETFQVQAGYMYTYQSTTKGYDHTHTPRINFIHTPDFRKKK